MAALDFFYFPGSTYTYLTVARIEERAAEVGVEVRWRPFNLRALLQETGVTPFPKGSAKAGYMWRDLERRAQRYGLPYPDAPPPYPCDPDLLNLRAAFVAEEEGWAAQHARASYRSWFMDHRAPGLADNMRSFLASLGHDPDRVMTRVGSPAIHDRLRASADEARELGLFGSPHFVVGGEVFWGDDRLEDALAWASGGRG